MAKYVDKREIINKIVDLTAYYDISEIKSACENLSYYDSKWICGIRDAILEIENAPPADVRLVVRGYNEYFDYSSLFKCSVCGWSCDDTTCGDTRTYNYCPNCGALMSAEENSDASL